MAGNSKNTHETAAQKMIMRPWLLLVKKVLEEVISSLRPCEAKISASAVAG